MLSYLILAGLLFLIVFLVSTDNLKVWHLPIITLGVGTVFAFLRPAQEVFLVESVKKTQILTANSLTALANNAAEMLAPALGAFAIARYSTESPFVLACVGYLFASALILRTCSKVTPTGTGTEHSLMQEIREGITYAVSNKQVLALLVIAATAVFGTAIVPLLPVYGRDVLDAGSSGYGVLAASLAAGYLVGSLLMTALGDVSRKGLLLLVTAAVWDIGAVIFGFSRMFPMSVVILVVMGVSGSMFVTLLISLIQQLTADKMRGRVLSLYNIAFSAMPIGFIVGGALAQAVSNEFALIFGALMGSPLIVILFLRIPSLRSL